MLITHIYVGTTKFISKFLFYVIYDVIIYARVNNIIVLIEISRGQAFVKTMITTPYFSITHKYSALNFPILDFSTT